MCNPIAMMGLTLFGQAQEEEIKKSQREQAKTSYLRAASAEGSRRDTEALAARMEADKITRTSQRSASSARTAMAGAGVEIHGIVEQWGHIEAEKLGTLGAKEDMLAHAGDLRMQELVNARDQRLSAAARGGAGDWLMAAATGYIQGKLIQKQLSPSDVPAGAEGASVPEDASMMDKIEDWIDKLLLGMGGAL